MAIIAQPQTAPGGHATGSGSVAVAAADTIVAIGNPYLYAVPYKRIDWKVAGSITLSAGGLASASASADVYLGWAMDTGGNSVVTGVQAGSVAKTISTTANATVSDTFTGWAPASASEVDAAGGLYAVPVLNYSGGAGAGRAAAVSLNYTSWWRK